MNLYMAGSTFAGLNEWMQDNGYNKLLSYVNDTVAVDTWINYAKQTGSNKAKLFIDSGAFTAWTKNTEIDVDKYIQWLNERSEYIYLFGQVDSIPGNIKKGATQQEVEEAAKKTWDNYLYMRSKVNNPDGLLYTFHVGEPYEFLKQAMEWTDEKGEHIKYIALGGMVGKTTEVRETFLDTCFSIIEKSSNPNVKTHAFGMTSLDLLQKYPITSADSTSWIMTAVTGSVFSPYGTICLSEESEKRKENFCNQRPAKQKVILQYIQSKGFEFEKLKTDYKQREEFNITYLQDWASNYEYKPSLVKLGYLF